MSGKGNKAPSTKVVKPKTKAGIRALERRAPKIVRRCKYLNANKPEFCYNAHISHTFPSCRLKSPAAPLFSMAIKRAKSSKMS